MTTMTPTPPLTTAAVPLLSEAQSLTFSDTTPAAPASVSVTEDQIAQYLLATPEFFTRHASLLASVQLTPAHGGRAISLTDRQMQLQRERYKELEAHHSKLLRIGRENVMLAGKLHQWMLGLLAIAKQPGGIDAHGTPAGAQLCALLQATFDVPQVILDQSELALEVAAKMTAPVCGLAQDAFFTQAGVLAQLPQPDQAASLAVMGLPQLGLLVLASESNARFTFDMDTDFLTRLGELAQATLHGCAD